MVLVMPSINGSGRQYQDCVNGPGINDDTYLTKDVRTDVLARYRVSQDPYEWGLCGYSSGGYCAANLALRHRSSFGAAAVINGYFRAADGPAGAALNHSQPLEAANSPLYLAERLTPDGSPVPAFWVAAGTNDKADYKPATCSRPRSTASAGPLLQATTRRHRQRLVGRPARRAGLAVAAAGTARPAGPVPRARPGQRTSPSCPSPR